MTAARIVDIACVLLAAILPIVLIWRWNVLGLALGVLTVWMILALAGVILSALDPSRDAALMDAIWYALGWLGGLIYCLPLYALKRLYFDKRRSLTASRGD